MANPPTGFDHGVTLEATQTILRETLAEGRRLGLAPLTVVVLDQAAQLKGMLREDGCSLLRPGIAQGKANAALALGFGGRELARRALNMPAFMNALSDLTGGSAVPVPGGVLLRDSAGKVLGAVGVSGDLSEKDEAAAVAGIKAAGLVPDTGD